MARLNSKWLIAGGVALSAVALGKAIKTKRVERRREKHSGLVGEVCRVRSRKVIRRLGRADFHDGQGGKKIKVRWAKGVTLARGDMARIVAFHAETNVYEIEPVR